MIVHNVLTNSNKNVHNMTRVFVCIYQNMHGGKMKSERRINMWDLYRMYTHII